MSRAIVITGGSRGIGRATAILAGRRGWSVAINYLGNRAAAEATAAAVTEAGGRAIIAQGNMRHEADVVALFAAARAAFGPLHGVVNNAGVVDRASQLADMSVERLTRMFETNILGAYLVAREAARHLSRRRGGPGGALVNVSSTAARMGSPNQFVDYAGSKGAVDTLTLGLAQELGPEGVRVNSVRPGLIDTDIHASGGDPDRAQRLGAMAPLGRPGQPTEVAEAIIWLLDDASSYVTGAILDVAGGR